MKKNLNIGKYSKLGGILTCPIPKLFPLQHCDLQNEQHYNLGGCKHQHPDSHCRGQKVLF